MREKPLKLESLHSLYVPARTSPSYLMICLHGSGGTMRDFEDLDQELGLPRLAYLYLNAPYKSYAGYSWYQPGVEVGKALDQAAHRIAAAQKEISALGFAPQRCFWMGFSQGAQLMLHYAVHHSIQSAGLIGISGQVYDLPHLLQAVKASNARRAPWLITHGIRDKSLSAEISRTQAEKIREAGIRLDYYEFDKAHHFDVLQELPIVSQWIRRNSAM